jgi:predicted RNA-binding Zn ribbon-like protein
MHGSLLARGCWCRRGVPVDGLATRQDLVAWLAAHREQFQAAVDPNAAGHHLKEVRGLRDTLRELVAAAVAGQRAADAAIETLNRLSRQAPTAPQLGWPPAGQPSVTVQSATADPGAVVLAELARAGIGLLGGPDRQRLRACQAPGCVLFFVKQHPRREWCSQACGNRARAARHYVRHRPTPAPPGSEPTAPSPRVRPPGKQRPSTMAHHQPAERIDRSALSRVIR